MTDLRVSLSGFDAVYKKLHALVNALDEKEVLDEAEALLLNRVRKRYLAETDPDGQKWLPSAAGLERRKGGGTGTLFDTGKLFHSINAYRLSEQERAIGTDIPYARYHQLGGGQVKREFLGFGQEDIELAEKLVLMRISEALEGV